MQKIDRNENAMMTF